MKTSRERPFGRGASRRRGARGPIERLEGRELLTLTVGTINPVEGQPFSGPVATFLAGDVANPPDTYAATIDWGDGSPTPGAILATGVGTYEVRGSKTFGEEGQFPLKVSLVPAGTTTPEKSALGKAVVADAPLSATGATVAATATQPFTGVVARFTDADPAGTAADYTATIAWGDGNTTPGTIAADASGGFNVSGTHTYATPGNKAIAVAIADVGGSTASANSAAKVADPAPVVTAGAITVLSGLPFNNGQVATFTDADPALTASDFAATIDWGDGHTTTGTVAPNAGGGFRVSGSHTYAATMAGNQTFKVTVFRLTDNTSGMASGTAILTEPVLAATGLTIAPAAGLPYNGPVATFTDNNPAAATGDYTATIDWGDGHTSAGTIAPNVGGGFVVNGTNTYATARSYPTNVTVTRIANGQVALARGQANVAVATLTVAGVDVAPEIGRPFTGAVATIADNNPTAMPSDYTATIDWGDGTAPTAGVVTAKAGGGFNVSGTHTYADVGADTVRIAVRRIADGQTASAIAKATITDLAPVVTGRTIQATAGRPFTGTTVATFTDANPRLTPADFTATIDWGDQTPATVGTIAMDAPGRFHVVGSHTYAQGGNDAFTVTVFRATDNVSAQGKGTAVISAPTLTAAGTSFAVPVGVPFTAAVATFSDSAPGARATDFTAAIDWGDGNPAEPGVVVPVAGGFAVVGAHTYRSIGTDPTRTITVTIARASAPGAPVTVKSTALVAARPFSGALSPISDTGASATDGVTSSNQPTFLGTAEPFALIRLYGQRADQLAPVQLGTTAAGADGTWQLTVGPLADGVYAISATEILAAGPVNPTIPLAPGGRLVVDTQGPTVVGVAPAGPGRFVVTFRDGLSGMDAASLGNPLSYELIGPHPLRRLPRPNGVVPVPTVAVLPTDPQSVRLSFPRGPRARHLRILPGVIDVAGNPLQPFAEGGLARRGQPFVTRLGGRAHRARR